MRCARYVMSDRAAVHDHLSAHGGSSLGDGVYLVEFVEMCINLKKYGRKYLKILSSGDIL